MITTIKIKFNENNLDAKQQKCLDDIIKLENPFGDFDQCEGDNYLAQYIRDNYSCEQREIAHSILKKVRELIEDKGTKAAYKYLKEVCPLYNH